ncbi:MAG: T9SS type A sorting domain-containing protein [Williamsia sp.]|nr:T9SS type A sorting domain-containing protein [Williamsia sp.]
MKEIVTTLFLLLQVAVAAAQKGIEQKGIRSVESMAAAEQRGYERRHEAALRTLSVASNNFDVYFYRCEWTIDPAVRYISGRVTAYFTSTAAANSLVFDLHNALTVDSVLNRGSKLSFQQGADNSLTIRLPQTIAAGQKDSLSISYQGVPVDDGFGSFVTGVQGNVPVLWTLSEPYGAKDWWPCKNAQADKADSIDVILTYPAIYNSSSNGVLTEEKIAGDKKTSYWKHRYPIASYLIAIAVTNYVTETDSVLIGNTLMPVRMRSYAGAAEYFRSATLIAKGCLQKFSSLFGPYPFLKEGYSQTQFGWGGGMEHQTNSFINSSYDQLVAHELSHQWFGDRVTCRSWQDIWLNEGFAQYMQYIYLENFAADQKLAHLNTVRTKIIAQPGGSVRVSDTSTTGRIFDSRLSYLKGSYLLHMIRWKLGDSLFFKALQQYLNDPLISYGTATTAGLQRNLESISGKSFARFFANWYEGEGFPSYQVTWMENKNNQVKIKLDQTTSHPSVSFYEMPVPLQLKRAGRDTMVVLDHTYTGQEFWVDAGFLVDTIVFDPALWLLTNNNTVRKLPASSASINDIKIYPNPPADHVTVSIANPAGRRFSLQLYNTAAQLLYKMEGELARSDQLSVIPFAALPSGVYWLTIGIDGRRLMIKKLVK